MEELVRLYAMLANGGVLKPLRFASGDLQRLRSLNQPKQGD